MNHSKFPMRRAAVAFLLTALLQNAVPAALACGPFLLEPLFSLTKHADYPLQDYARGVTGVVPPTFGRMSLFVFYRELTGAPLSAEERKQVVAALTNRIGKYETENEAAENAEPKPAPPPDFYRDWQKARARLAADETKIETEKAVPDQYYYFSNCLADAFANAAATLDDRLARYGAGEATREWLKGQDAVFANCETARGLPEPARDDAPAWLKADRAYQIAAAQFYRGDYADARTSFQSIAADAASPWRATARLVAARTLIRQASFIEIPEAEGEAKTNAAKQKAELLRQAASELEAIAGDASEQSLRASARRLLGLVKYRMIPVERRRELGKILMRREENANIYNDLTDYIWLLSRVEEQAFERGLEYERQLAEKEGKTVAYDYNLKIRDVPPEDRADDLTDWLFTYQAADGAAHAFEKWKGTARPHWLVAALVSAAPDGPQTAELMRDADKIAPDAPGAATVRYHQIRILLETGRRAEAAKKLDEVMAKRFASLPVSSQNKFLAQRTALAADLDEFLKYAQRRPALFVWSDDGAERGSSIKNDKTYGVWENRTMFDEDAVAFLNEKLPLAELRRAVFSLQLPTHLRKMLVVAVWTRAFALSNEAVMNEFTPLVVRHANDLAPLVVKYAAATGPADREAAALVAVLRQPIVQPYVPVGYGREDSTPTTIDSIRGNWWCVEAKSDEDKSRYNRYPFTYPAVYPDFLTAAQKAAAERELKQLAAAGDSATHLARRAVAFAERHPAHPQTPEILHLAVRATRYGCTDEQTGTFSKRAFDFLHKRFPASPWTKQTPYWFNGQ